jgi:hypothetical protein
MPLRLINTGQTTKKYVHHTKIGREMRTVTQTVFRIAQLAATIIIPVSRIDQG